jgi:hypothetical protein
MMPTDLRLPAQVIVLPARPRSESPRTARQNVSVEDAVRYVMEGMPAEQRPRAIVRTSTRLMFFAEIAAIHDRLPSAA